jgi:hypothetical protein
MQARRPQGGCTLTEALITLAILSFGVASIVRLQLDLLLATGQGKARTEALALVEARLEQLRVVAREDPYISSSGSEIDLDGSNSRFELHWSIDPASGGVHYALQVATRWIDPRGETQELTLESLLPSSDPAWAARVFD